MRSCRFPEEEFENVFTVTFVESDTDSRHEPSPLVKRRRTFDPLPCNFVGSPFQIRVSADDILVATEPRRHFGGQYFAGNDSDIDLLEGEAMLTVFAGEEFFVRLTAAAVISLACAKIAASF